MKSSALVIVVLTTLAAHQVAGKLAYGKCQTPNLQPEFQAEKYTGVWYEYARAENSFQSDKATCTSAEYGAKDLAKAEISVVNTQFVEGEVKNIDGYADCNHNDTPAWCKVFFPSVPFQKLFGGGDYRIVETDYT
eukprot:CAMPEP_0115013114 /NCGR_PEP_ID=MMETSP0216-20121206/25192_1 /TAXON_ID=223996 /ORGANISM="Protocruzia adherens, Strain Boccale" /LENGTH=134 /DNA_ID=CAMNT_0002382405 /DNA_START=36 /DNA_END=436 /DNA_ORIENTATION=+